MSLPVFKEFGIILAYSGAQSPPRPDLGPVAKERGAWHDGQELIEDRLRPVPEFFGELRFDAFPCVFFHLLGVKAPPQEVEEDGIRVVIEMRAGRLRQCIAFACNLLPLAASDDKYERVGESLIKSPDRFRLRSRESMKNPPRVRVPAPKGPAAADGNDSALEASCLRVSACQRLGHDGQRHLI